MNKMNKDWFDMVGKNNEQTISLSGEQTTFQQCPIDTSGLCVSNRVK